MVEALGRRSRVRIPMTSYLFPGEDDEKIVMIITMIHNLFSDSHLDIFETLIMEITISPPLDGALGN